MSNRTDDIIRFESEYCAHNYDPLPVVIDKAQDVWLWDVEGKKYLDIMGAYSALSHGHSHPRLVHKLTNQAHKLAVTSRAVFTQALGLMAQKLCQVAGLDRMLPMNTGAEAVDTALKAARKWGYEIRNIPEDKAEIVVVKNNFHGRTFGAISLSGSHKTVHNFGPLLSGIRTVPFGDADALSQTITPYTCAVFMEPTQGEAGIIIPPEGYLKSVRQICSHNHVLMILDEIQSGLGRTGKWFCFQHEDILPDGITVGKALGGGLLPVSAFVATNELMSVFTPGTHGSTFGGNPLACTVALEALMILEEEGLIERSATLGKHLLQRLQAWDYPCVTGVRGRGLWAGVDLTPDKISGHELCVRLLSRGILAKETREQTLRIAPPLTISQADLDWALDEIEAILQSL